MGGYMNLKLLVLLCLAFFSSQAFSGESVYTSVDVNDCIVLDSADYDEEYEIDYLDALCKGIGPYTVRVAGGDLRYGISLLYRGSEIQLMESMFSFHDLGSKVVEWRFGKNNAGERVFKAFIFRVFSYEESSKNSHLHVVKLNKSETCTVSVLTNEPDANNKAREIADNIENYSCSSDES